MSNPVCFYCSNPRYRNQNRCLILFIFASSSIFGIIVRKNNSKNEEKRLFLHGFRTQKEQFKKWGEKIRLLHPDQLSRKVDSMRWCALASAFGPWEVQTQAIQWDVLPLGA
jgi:hypothetical protein